MKTTGSYLRFEKNTNDGKTVNQAYSNPKNYGEFNDVMNPMVSYVKTRHTFKKSKRLTAVSCNFLKVTTPLTNIDLETCKLVQCQRLRDKKKESVDMVNKNHEHSQFVFNVCELR